MMICRGCRKDMPVKARKMCACCYGRWRRKRLRTKCKSCDRMIHGGTKLGMCHLCCCRLIGSKRYGYSLDYFDD